MLGRALRHSEMRSVQRIFALFQFELGGLSWPVFQKRAARNEQGKPLRLLLVKKKYSPPQLMYADADGVRQFSLFRLPTDKGEERLAKRSRLISVPGEFLSCGLRKFSFW